MTQLLLCESDEILTECYQELLAGHGCDVEIAKDGALCLASLRRGLPHLMILDLDIRCGGAEKVLDWLTSDRGSPPIPIILTALPGRAYQLARFSQVPGIVSLPKPFRLPVLLDCVRMALRWLPHDGESSAPGGVHDRQSSPLAPVPVYGSLESTKSLQ